MRKSKSPWDEPPNDLECTARSDTRSRQAETARRNAGIERGMARQAGPEAAAARLKDAERLDRVASDLMKPTSTPLVSCGEITRAGGENAPARQIVDTLSNPDQAAIDASIARTDLLLSGSAEVVPLALDTAASVNAGNSLEKMLAHQLGLLHALVMRTGNRALESEKRQGGLDEELKQSHSVELGRLAQTTGRLAAAFQNGILTLQRMRNGSAQTVTVHHVVNVQPGGQALIGIGTPGGRRSKKGNRGKGQE